MIRHYSKPETLYPYEWRDWGNILWTQPRHVSEKSKVLAASGYSDPHASRRVHCLAHMMV